MFGIWFPIAPHELFIWEGGGGGSVLLVLSIVGMSSSVGRPVFAWCRYLPRREGGVGPACIVSLPLPHYLTTCPVRCYMGSAVVNVSGVTARLRLCFRFAPLTELRPGGQDSSITCRSETLEPSPASVQLEARMRWVVDSHLSAQPSTKKSWKWCTARISLN